MDGHMYHPHNYTYSSSPEDDDDGEQCLLSFSSSSFHRMDPRVDASGRAGDASPPPMLASALCGGVEGVNRHDVGQQDEDKKRSTSSSTSSNKLSPLFGIDVAGGVVDTSYAAAPYSIASSMESTVSAIIAAAGHKSSNQQQQHQLEYGHLQEQYGLFSPEHLLFSGFTNTSPATKTAASAGATGGDTTSSASNIDKIRTSGDMGGNGQEVSTSRSNNSGNGRPWEEEDDDDEKGHRQYQDIMSATPILSTNVGHYQDDSSALSIGKDRNPNEGQGQWQGVSTASPAKQTATAASPSLHQPQKNEGGATEGTRSVGSLAASLLSSLWSNNEDNNRPMVFHGKGSFPLNLALMLESVERPLNYEDGSHGGKMNHIISWLPCGRVFAIHNTDLFLSEVLPNFFKSSQNTKLRSFYRKLNRWGFTVLRSTELNQSGMISPIKNAWHHPDFSRERAVECLLHAQQSGDTDYSHMLNVTHVSVGESGSAVGNEGKPESGSGVGGGEEGQNRRGKRINDYSIESNMDMDTTSNEFNSSFSTLESKLSRRTTEGVSFMGSKRRGSDRDTSHRMSWSWTAGVPAHTMSSYRAQVQGDQPSWTLGGGSGVAVPKTKNAVTSWLYNNDLRQSWTACNPGSSDGGASAATDKDAATSWLYNHDLTQSWTAGSNPEPVPNTSQSSSMPQSLTRTAGTRSPDASVQPNQSWTVAGFTPYNSQLSRIQFNPLTNNQLSTPATATGCSSKSNSYDEWKKMVMQCSRHSGGFPSPSLGQDHQQKQQAWGNDRNVSQVAYAQQLNSNGNGNACRSPANSPFAQSQEQQQWSQFHRHQQQYQHAQLNRGQGDQQQQPHEHEEGNYQQQQDQDQGGEGLSHEDIDLRMFFERYAEKIRDDDSDRDK